MKHILIVIYKVVQLLRLRLIASERHCIIEKKVICDQETYLEGYNRICRNSQIMGTHLGRGTYIGWNSVMNNGDIGRFCSIAPYVECIYGCHPLTPMVSTHPSFFSLSKQAGFTFVKEQKFDESKYIRSSGRSVSFKIGNDVWIGYGVRIMEGVEIGDGAVVAAGALVTKNIPDFQIWGGVPAKRINDRFTEEQKDMLIKIKWWDEDFSVLKDKAYLFTNINEFLKNEKDYKAGF